MRLEISKLSLNGNEVFLASHPPILPPEPQKIKYWNSLKDKVDYIRSEVAQTATTHIVQMNALVTPSKSQNPDSNPLIIDLTALFHRSARNMESYRGKERQGRGKVLFGFVSIVLDLLAARVFLWDAKSSCCMWERTKVGGSVLSEGRTDRKLEYNVAGIGGVGGKLLLGVVVLKRHVLGHSSDLADILELLGVHAQEELELILIAQELRQ